MRSRHQQQETRSVCFIRGGTPCLIIATGEDPDIPIRPQTHLRSSYGKRSSYVRVPDLKKQVSGPLRRISRTCAGNRIDLRNVRKTFHAVGRPSISIRARKLNAGRNRVGISLVNDTSSNGEDVVQCYCSCERPETRYRPLFRHPKCLVVALCSGQWTHSRFRPVAIQRNRAHAYQPLHLIA